MWLSLTGHAMVENECVVASINKMNDAFSRGKYNSMPIAVISDHLPWALTSHFILLVVQLDVLNTNTESKLNKAKKKLYSTAIVPFYTVKQK